MTRPLHRRCAAALLVLTALAWTASASGQVSYTYRQAGYADGGVVTGSFEGADLDSDGMLLSFLGEITGFSLSFSGTTSISPFTHGYGDLYGLAFQIGSPTLGGGSSGIVPEGIASNLLGGVGFEYLTGIGPTGGLGGRITDLVTGVSTTTSQLVQVTVVPEPNALILMLSGLGFIGWGVGRHRASGRTPIRAAG